MGGPTGILIHALEVQLERGNRTLLQRCVQCTPITWWVLESSVKF